MSETTREAPTDKAPTDEGPVDQGAVDQGAVDEATIVDAIRTVYDPEIPVNIYDLGLIYAVDISADGDVHVTMTVTAPACPVADILPVEVEERVRAVPGVREVSVDLVWDPPWSPERMSEAARLELGMF